MNYLVKISQFTGKTFALWVILFAVLGFAFPSQFTWISPYITILLGVIMFGMGLTLSADDFKELLRKPLHVVIGVIVQFTVMPLTAVALAYGLNLPPDIAVGVILVGCCPGGTASNVMTYLAKGNTALSVAITTISTLLAPVLTPFLIMLFAKEWLPVSFASLFVSILQAVLIPIILGLIVQFFFKKQVEQAVQVLPLVSVIGIVAIVAAVVGGNRDNIIQSGLLIFAVVVLHNGLGLLLRLFAGKMLQDGLCFAKSRLNRSRHAKFGSWGGAGNRSFFAAVCRTERGFQRLAQPFRFMACDLLGQKSKEAEKCV